MRIGVRMTPSDSHVCSPTDGRNAPVSGWRSGASPIFLLAAYFAVMAVLGATLPIADSDDAEQIVHMQFFDWGYVGAQPALYTWLAQLVALVVQPDLAAVRVTRFICLLATFGGVYASARAGGLTRKTAIGATFGMFLLTQIGGEDTWRFSHVLAANAAMAWLPAAFFRATSRRSWASWGGVGAVVAAALLGKYSTAFPLLAFFLAALSMPSLRPRLATARALAAPLVLAVLLAGPFAWFAIHALPQTGDLIQQKIIAAPELWTSRAIGLARFVAAVAYSIYLWLAVGLLAASLVAFRLGRLPRPAAGATPFEILLWRSIAVFTVLVLALILVTGTTEVKAHWLQPCVLLLVLGSAATLERLEGGDRVLRLLGLAGAVAAAINLALMGGAAIGKTNRTGPIRVGEMADLVDALREPIGQSSSIVTNWMPLSGNLRVELPGMPVLMPGMTRAPEHMGDRVLLIWTTSATMPKSLEAFATANRLDLSAPPVTVWIPAVDMTDGLRSYTALPTTRPGAVQR